MVDLREINNDTKIRERKHVYSGVEDKYEILSYVVFEKKELYSEIAERYCAFINDGEPLVDDLPSFETREQALNHIVKNIKSWEE